MDPIFKTPRLYVDIPLMKKGDDIPLSESQIHYLKNVMRRQLGDQVRLFNGRDGEWACTLEHFDKRGGTARAQDIIRPQGGALCRTHLFFPPLKKEPLDTLIQKTVELGVTHFHPVLTDQADVRTMNMDRIAAQVTEAAEQCERLDIPVIAPLCAFKQMIADAPCAGPIFVAVERAQLPGFAASVLALPAGASCGFLIGPAGGWSAAERDLILSQKGGLVPVSLGDTILRAETAAIAMAAVIAIG
jgi:16S rRNA (uracil1498-N3)-methyltransferase